MWESVRANDKNAVYCHIICSEADVNSIHGQASYSTKLPLSKVMQLEVKEIHDCKFDCFAGDSLGKRASYSKSSEEGEDRVIEECSDGCSLLHLACLAADIGMVELLLQYGANLDAMDSRGRTPLHHCIISRRYAIAKLLLTRGADPQAVDREGNTPLRYVSESDLADKEIIALLADMKR